MKVAFFCTGGFGNDSKYTPYMTNFPSRAYDWDEAAKKHPDMGITLYVNMPGSFMVDTKDRKLTDIPKLVKYVELPFDMTEDEVAERIAADKPDMAIAISVPDIPYDWNTVRDSIIAERLNARGILTLAHPVKTAMYSFEKNRTQELLESKGFCVARHVFVESSLFFCDRDKDVTRNSYRDYVFYMISKLHFPVVIKPSACSGSVGLVVKKTIYDAKQYITENAKELDLMVEEWIEGENFGIEIYGTPGNYQLTSPIIFSSTGEGVTDPFASVKFGPVDPEKYGFDELRYEMIRMANELSLIGWAEIDLIFSYGRWYIVEVNTRYSMLSLMPAAMRGESIFSPYLDILTGDHIREYKEKYCVDFKTALMSDEKLEEIKNKYDFVGYIMRFALGGSSAAEGYIEFVVTGDDKLSLWENITLLKRECGIVSDATCENILKIIGSEGND